MIKEKNTEKKAISFPLSVFKFFWKSGKPQESVKKNFAMIILNLFKTSAADIPTHELHIFYRIAYINF